MNEGQPSTSGHGELRVRKTESKNQLVIGIPLVPLEKHAKEKKTRSAWEELFMLAHTAVATLSSPLMQSQKTGAHTI